MRAIESKILVAAVAALFVVPAAAFAEEPAADADADLAQAGKVIEVDPDGASRVTKGGEDEAGEPKAEEKKAPKDAPTRADSCRQRFAAQCKALKRCLKSSGGAGLQLPCDEMTGLCGQLQGNAPYSRKELKACVQGIAKLRCDSPIDPANPASFDFEGRVPACKKVIAAERAAGGAAPMDPGAAGKGNLGQFDLNKALGQ